jgi:zinc protease
VTLPDAHAASAIELLPDVGVNASLDEAVIEEEKRVVLEEMRRTDDSPRAFLGRRLFVMTFDGHPYGRPVIGEEDVIRSLSRQTLVSFYRRHYVPESFVLVVVGAVRPDDVLASASRAFGRLPRAATARLPVRAPGPAAPRRDELPRPGRLAYLGLAWHGPQVSHADAPAVALLVSILGQGRSSRLTQGLRERLGLVTVVSARYTRLEAAGVLLGARHVSPRQLRGDAHHTVREVRRLAHEGPSEIERRRAVTRAEAQHEFSLETAEGRAHSLGRAETTWRTQDELAWVDRLRSVTREQIRVVTRRYIDPDCYVHLALVPPLGTAR